MAEANEQASTTTLPGGFESVEDMHKALETLKADLTTHKTRAADVEAMKEKLTAYEAAESKRREAEMSELEKAQARIAALEGDLTAKEQAILNANRSVMLERVLSKRLAGHSDSVRGIARKLYEAAAVDFADEEQLNSLLDPVDEELKQLVQPAETGGARPTMGPIGSPGGKPSPQAAAEAKAWMGLSFTEKQRRAREARKR